MKRVKWKVQELARTHGIASAEELRRRAGINKNTASAIWNDRSVRADLLTIEKICRTLECQPGDLMELTEEDSQPVPLAA